MERFRDTRYQVTMDGRVWSDITNRFLKPTLDKDGYQYVSICINGIRPKFRVHQMVAEVFVPNPDDKPLVNHKDGVKSNNDYMNLEWSTPGGNTIHSFNNRLQRPSNCRSIVGISGHGQTVFVSISEASRQMGIRVSSIQRVLRGERRSAGGYIWKYNE